MLYICKFSQVELTKPKPLVICDIDDTCITWEPGYSELLKQLRGKFQDEFTDAEFQEEMRDFKNTYVMLNPPSATDLDGFHGLVDKVKAMGGDICFLTARNKKTHTNTIKHLTDAGIADPHLFDIHYTDNFMNKGVFITHYLDTQSYGEVVFIDDSDAQLSMVSLLHPNIRVCKFMLP